MGFSLLSAVEEEDEAAVLVLVKLFCLPPFVYIQGVLQKLCLFLKNFFSSLPLRQQRWAAIVPSEQDKTLRTLAAIYKRVNC